MADVHSTDDGRGRETGCQGTGPLREREMEAGSEEARVTAGVGEQRRGPTVAPSFCASRACLLRRLCVGGQHGAAAACPVQQQRCQRQHRRAGAMHSTHPQHGGAARQSTRLRRAGAARGPRAKRCLPLPPRPHARQHSLCAAMLLRPDAASRSPSLLQRRTPEQSRRTCAASRLGEWRSSSLARDTQVLRRTCAGPLPFAARGVVQHPPLLHGSALPQR